MIDTPISYVSRTPEGDWRLTGTRVTLDSVVLAYWDGASPEGIQELFPTLTLESIHGALAYYLRHREEIDRHLEDQPRDWERLRQTSEAENGPLLSRLRASRREDWRKGQSA